MTYCYSETDMGEGKFQLLYAAATQRGVQEGGTGVRERASCGRGVRVCERRLFLRGIQVARCIEMIEMLQVVLQDTPAISTPFKS